MAHCELLSKFELAPTLGSRDLFNVTIENCGDYGHVIITNFVPVKRDLGEDISGCCSDGRKQIVGLLCSCLLLAAGSLQCANTHHRLVKQVFL